MESTIIGVLIYSAPSVIVQLHYASFFDTTYILANMLDAPWCSVEQYTGYVHNHTALKLTL